MKRIRRRGRTLVVLAAVLGTACGRKEASGGGGGGGAGTETAPAAAPGSAAPAPAANPAAQAQLDSGNLAYRAHQYTGALAHYRQAAAADSQLAAAWFGMYMAQTSLGDKAGADSSMKKVQQLSPGMMQGHPGAGAPGSSALPPGHPSGPGMEGSTSPGALPPGHPSVPGKTR